MAEENIPKVLIVDDNPANLYAFDTLLVGLGANICKADSGRAALRLLLREDFALILLDVKMPEMDGVEVAVMIRQNARTKDIPIIFMTAFYQNEKQVLSAYKIGGVIDFIFKPIVPAILKAKVSVFIDLHRKNIELKLISEEQKAEIALRKESEEKIKASLREKDLLISEIHHRVKNNLQVISGLLQLQAKASKNPELIESFQESQNRIHAMSMIHERLYTSGDFSHIDLTDYIKSLSQELLQSYNINPGNIEITIQADREVLVNINRAIPCGLVMNELITNALKHAFPGNRPGELKIILCKTKDNGIEIIVNDNGLGLPDDVDIHQPKTMGLDLVNGLVKNQLYGRIEVKRDKGTEFLIVFPS